MIALLDLFHIPGSNRMSSEGCVWCAAAAF
jgi:hypothetical protein